MPLIERDKLIKEIEDRIRIEYESKLNTKQSNLFDDSLEGLQNEQEVAQMILLSKFLLSHAQRRCFSTTDL